MFLPKWNPKKFVHKPEINSLFPEVALIVDSTTLEINRPGSYSESKPFFDAKNWIYGLKKQVCVMPVSPHYALFSSKSFKGSEHDYTFFQIKLSGNSSFFTEKT